MTAPASSRAGDRRLNLVLIGPPGSGKGTQAIRLAERYKVPHISTGDILRAAVRDGTRLGRQVAAILAAGSLVGDDVITDLVRERLREPDARSGFVLDGYPRTVPQADTLDELLAELGRPLSIVLELQVPDEICVRRMLKRAEEEGRPDDTPEAIARRLEIYHRDTAPLVDHYLGTGKVVGIHGEGTVDDVYAEIQDALEQVRAAA